MRRHKRRVFDALRIAPQHLRHGRWSALALCHTSNSKVDGDDDDVNDGNSNNEYIYFLMDLVVAPSLSMVHHGF